MSLIAGQMTLEECIALSEACDDCPDQATCQAENACLAELEPTVDGNAMWDDPEELS
jgi:hypothetical protein